MGERASLTTFFRPFLTRLDSAVKTVQIYVSYNHSQVSRASIHTPCANVWKFMSSNSLSCEIVRFFRLQFLVSPAEATTGNTSPVRRLRIHHPVSPQPPRVFRIFFNTSLLNDFLPLYWSLKQAITTTAQIAGLSSAIADRSNENQA